MKFLEIKELKNSYDVIYQIFENGTTILKNFSVKDYDFELEKKVSAKLTLDTNDRYKVVYKNNEFYVRRNNNYY